MNLLSIYYHHAFTAEVQLLHFKYDDELQNSIMNFQQHLDQSVSIEVVIRFVDFFVVGILFSYLK